jgi:hypothetical protein
LYVEGEVKFVKAVELGAEANGSRTCKSWGETVPMLVELDEDRFTLGSYMVGTAGDEKADDWYACCVEAPPSNAVKSSKRSMS